MKSYDLTDGHEPVSWEEIDYLKQLAATLPPDPLIVNIGAATGVSTCAFLEARPDCHIYSIDIEECPQEKANVIACGLDAARLIPLLGDSVEIGPHFPHQADLLFVDGDHWGAGKDIEAWVMTGKVKIGGIIAFHDYQPEGCAPNNPGSVAEDVQARMAGFTELGRAERVIAFEMMAYAKGDA